MWERGRERGDDMELVLCIMKNSPQTVIRACMKELKWETEGELIQ